MAKRFETEKFGEMKESESPKFEEIKNIKRTRGKCITQNK